MLTEDLLCADQDGIDAFAPYPASALDGAIDLAKSKLLSLQHQQGNWVFELEADCTIPAEYILMMHYLDEIDPLLQSKIANFLRGQQKPDGSYP